jgi:SAM-dependent methyltransferase
VYSRSAPYYDALYRSMGKDYVAEAQRVRDIVTQHKHSEGHTLLDVACGTGLHLAHLRNWFECEGVDADRSMLSIAAERCPGIPLQRMDMIGLNVGRCFDIITCLFSSVAYLPNAPRLDQVVRSFAQHLRPGGVAIVEPWLRPEQWEDGYLTALFVDEPDLKIARMSVSRRDGNVSILNFHFMVAQPDGIRTFTEPHRLTLFTDDEYRAAFEKAGLTVSFDPHGLSGRGLYIGTKP